MLGLDEFSQLCLVLGLSSINGDLLCGKLVDSPLYKNPNSSKHHSYIHSKQPVQSSPVVVSHHPYKSLKLLFGNLSEANIMRINNHKYIFYSSRNHGIVDEVLHPEDGQLVVLMLLCFRFDQFPDVDDQYGSVGAVPLVRVDDALGNKGFQSCGHLDWQSCLSEINVFIDGVDSSKDVKPTALIKSKLFPQVIFWGNFNVILRYVLKEYFIYHSFIFS